MRFRFDPLQELLSMQEQLDRLLGNEPKPQPRVKHPGAHWEPVADVVKTSEEFLIEVELPGIRRESVSLEVEGSKLVLAGVRPKAGELERGRFRRMEGEYGEFRRTFPLPPDVDLERIEATLSNGVLEVRLPIMKREINPE